MKIDNHENFVVLEDEQNNLEKFASFLEFQIPNKFKKQNVIINLLAIKELSLDDLLFFLKVSDIHRTTKHSFVLVNDTINPDDLPDEMTVVPTLQEAEDIVEMEDIERELGF